MGKWTKGPWRIGYAPPNGEQTIGTKGGLLVAVATTGAATTGADVPTLDNARLIAAAPELAEALDMMLRAWEEVGGSDKLIGYQKGVEALAKAGAV